MHFRYTPASPSTNAPSLLGPAPWSGALLAVVLMVLSVAALANEPVTPTLELSSVLVEVTWVANSRELAKFREIYETRAQRSDKGVKALSVLGKREGNWVCLIFVERPRIVNDKRTLQLGHEIAHCLLGAYHRAN